MRYPFVVLAASFLASALALGGCDLASVETSPVGQIEIDISPLTRLTSGDVQQICVSVADRAVLRVNGRTQQNQPLSHLLSTVVFEDVEAPAGSVQFDVEIRSTTDAVLYSGGSEEQIDGDQFSVTIQLLRRTGILQVCPAELHLLQNMDLIGSFRFMNLGSDSLVARTIEPIERCDGQPCVRFFPEVIPLAARMPMDVRVAASWNPQRTFVQRIDTEAGYLDLQIHVE